MINTTVKRPGLFFENVVFYFSFVLLALVAGAFFYVRHLTASATAELSNLEMQITQNKDRRAKAVGESGQTRPAAVGRFFGSDFRAHVSS